jgi:hypothetical protein
MVLATSGCATDPGPPVRLAASDTIVINSRLPAPLPVHALDANDDTITAPIRFQRVGGDSLPLTEAGVVTCTSAGNLSVRAVLDSLTALTYVRCLPVDYIRIGKIMQFVLGDSLLSRPQVLPVAAYLRGGIGVVPFNLRVDLGDTTVAAVRGTTIIPLRRGITVAGAYVGEREAGTGVHIYQRVETLDAIDSLLRVNPDARLFAVPLRLEPGVIRRHPLPPGRWMLTLLPAGNAGGNPIQLGVDSAACDVNLLNDPGRLGCRTGPHSKVEVYRRPGRGTAQPATGYLLVRWMYSRPTRHPLPRVPATGKSLGCVAEFLGGRGYDALPPGRDRNLLLVERRPSGIGTSARRERIEVRLTGATLYGDVWAVDSYPGIDTPSRVRAIVVDPLEATMEDGHAAAVQCGRH